MFLSCLVGTPVHSSGTRLTLALGRRPDGPPRPAKAPYPFPSASILFGVARHGRCRLLFRLGVQHITRQLHASLGLSLSGMQRCSHKRTGCRHKRTGNLPYGTLLVLRIRLQMESGFRSACCATTPPPSAGWPRARPSRPSCTCCAAQSGASLTLLEGPICNRYITALSRSTNCP